MFKIEKKDENSRARVGVLETAHGLVETPAYVIVGTHGKVRTLEPDTLARTKTQLIIANTYHLWQTFGDAGLADFPGLHHYMQWSGPLMTDSGGFQVFSLGFLREQGLRRKGTTKEEIKNSASEPPGKNMVRITEAGVYFHPNAALATEDEVQNIINIEEEESYLDPELSVRIQEQLGADIIVAFDEPTSPANTREYVEESLKRTHAWAQRSLEARSSGSRQLMYGVVQGAAFEDLRKESARVIGAMEFDGFALGGTYGDAYGGTKNETNLVLDWAIPLLPEDRPRHLFGVGRIEDIFEGIERGIDTFDCVIPTREARHGRIWSSEGYYNILKGKYRNDENILDPSCYCPACVEEGITRAQLHDRFKQKLPEAAAWATVHNVFFFNSLMEGIRNAIREGNFARAKKIALAQMARPLDQE